MPPRGLIRQEPIEGCANLSPRDERFARNSMLSPATVGAHAA